jgi:NAD+ diphosphatase
MGFKSDYKRPDRIPQEALWFLYQKQRLLVKLEGGNYPLPRALDLKELRLCPVRDQFLGWLDDHACYAGRLPEGSPESPSFFLLGLRDLYSRSGEDLFRAAGLGHQLVVWDQNHRFCGKCGGVTEEKKDERARVCPKCGLVNYPRLSPAIIVAVTKGDQILLAHSRRFPAAFYSVLAGFVEPGEGLEDCVRREVLEESGISLTNIRYFGSQPWPFPDSLMIAFTAEYAGGEIQVDRSEITEAGWFKADQLPAVPPRYSIARQLIDWFSQGMQQGKTGC